MAPGSGRLQRSSRAFSSTSVLDFLRNTLVDNIAIIRRLRTASRMACNRYIYLFIHFVALICTRALTFLYRSRGFLFHEQRFLGFI